MKAIVSALAVFARRVPWVVVVVTLILTGVLGFFSTQIEIASGNEGFAPDAKEISAQDRIRKIFGDDSGGTTMQVILRGVVGDVITVEGLKAARATAETIRASDVGQHLSETQQEPGVVHYLSGVEQAMAEQGMTIDQMTDDLVKQLYSASLAEAPPEQASFISRLVSEDFDPQTVSAAGGMVIAFVETYPGDGAEEQFDTQIEEDTALAEDLDDVETGLEIRPFSFGLLFSGFDNFTDE
ncbi:MAG TPA: hypothetical protein VE569_02425, partial [Acidimicrobiia bacterium]|nr:hypothetical protein [Acidimicrobiia bacterium]